MISEAMTEFNEPKAFPKPAVMKNVSDPVPNAAVIVAHPDDEALWCGGLILTHPYYSWFIVALCRKSDPDRSTKFFRALQIYGARGAIADMDDGPDQNPLLQRELQQEVLELLPAVTYDLVLTHAPDGEYTRHRRHEEVSLAVTSLWSAGAISAHELRLFAYQDNGQLLPQAIKEAHQYTLLPEKIWLEKQRLITDIYGFGPDSWEACITPKAEAFWRFQSPIDLQRWMRKKSPN